MGIMMRQIMALFDEHRRARTPSTPCERWRPAGRDHFADQHRRDGIED
jgi:hypothetical protein